MSPVRGGLRLAAVLGLLIALGGCRPRDRTPHPPSHAQAQCSVLAPADRQRGPLEIGLTASVDPRRAPEPQHAAERLVFRQFYETLVRVDCRGRLGAGLAGEWSREDGGRRWRFRLRKNARFSDSSPVTASDVRRAWLAVRSRAPAEAGRFPWSWVQDVSQLDGDAQTFTVTLNRSLEDARLFAHPSLAVTRAALPGAWPLGTGPFIPQELSGHRLSARPNAFHPGADRRAALSLSFVILPGVDGRDLMDMGVDLLLVRDRRTLAYAEAHAPWRAVALPWDRIYVLASPRLAAGAGQAWSSLPLPAELRARLAGDVVQGMARPANSFSFEDDDPTVGWPHARCAPLELTAGDPADRYILYPEADEDARAIAGRLVFLAGAEQGARTALHDLLCGGPQIRPLRAAGRDRRELAIALARGEDALFILPLERTLHQALPAHDLLRGALPLIATRPYLLARAGVSGVWIDWDGTLLFDAADAGPGGRAK